ncbi:MAG: hypothetical protein FFODKBPE_00416 [Candidatus Argoarchaeum ethanivorans]|uniref:Fido domain-containing protein n=1 Tax=Candidatus Argoarchaeum ethanivorans TaxID=2608793 RepID=A0A811TBK4_9EURY|nr:MAG: hypothetical protein FFODKBPE_00416 [Candidatus Argoarchaeum ethanivorans]
MIKNLELGEILGINEQIWKMSQKYSDIEYGAHDIYEIKKEKIRNLVDNTPIGNIINIATYYLKNLILLQPFPDANHRTAFEAVRYFLHKNNIEFRWDIDTIDEFHLTIYRLRFKIYGTYEELPANVLKEPKNELYNYCKDYIEKTMKNRT